MSAVLLEILNMSVMASIAACAVLLVRLLLRKAPRVFSYALWAVVLFRLLCPFKPESALSILPSSANTVPQNMIYSQALIISADAEPVANPESNMPLPTAYPVVTAAPIDVALNIAAWVWLAGVIVLFGYAIYSYIRLKLRLRTAVLVRENIWETGVISTPFVLGFIRPRIYLPVGAGETDYILAHEQTHIRRFDHLVKPVAFFTVCLHWFNPIVWLSYTLFCKDMEISCDESVLKRSGDDIRVRYSGSLLALSVKQSGLISPLAFGESNTKARVKNALRYKKPSLWISFAAVAAVIAVTVGFAATRAQEAMPWTGVPQKSDWPVRDMSFDRVTFGSDRDLIVYRWGREPDSEDVLADETILYYHDPGAIYTPEGGQPSIVPGSAFDVTYYLGKNDCMYKKNLHGVYRIDIDGGNPGMFEMTGREMSREGIAGTLEGVLDEYGGPNDVTHNGSIYTLWYYRPDDTDKRLWFDVKDGELTGRMGIVCLCEGEGVGAADAMKQLAGSVTGADGQIRFQIPPHYYRPFDWNIHISGRSASEDGMSMSVHELEDVNSNHAWEAGQWYSIPLEGRNLTELTMDIYLPDENGNILEQSIDLVDNVGDTAGIIPDNLRVPEQ